jgi:FkbM family methyltransferase
MLFPYAKGHYVEIGVHNPKTQSNTYIFYEMGWTGIMIEPLPYWVRMGRHARPNDIYIQVAASNKEGEASLHLHENHSPACSLREDWLEKGCNKIQVTIKRLETILEPYPDIRNNCDFCSIDVEGHEKEVLMGNNFDTFKPTVICLEAVRWSPVFRRIHSNWEDILFDNGYSLICHNFQNRFYGRKDNAALWENVDKWNLRE